MNKSLNRALRQVKGLIISWSDDDPLSTNDKLGDCVVTHKNPVYRLVAAQIFKDYGNLILYKQPLRWLINIAVVFKYPNKVEQKDLIELEGRATIDRLNDDFSEQIEHAFRCGNMDYYETTHIKITCLGL